MIKSIPVRVAILAVIILVALITLYPTMAQNDPGTGKAILPGWWSALKFLPQKRISLGLDLRGGIYLVYTIKVDEVSKVEAENLIQTVDSEQWQTEGIKVTNAAAAPDGKVRITFADQDSLQKGGKKAQEHFGKLWDIEADRDDPMTFVFTIKPVELQRAKENAIQQVRRTVSTRVDAWGLAETSVQIKMPDQLVIELPGITETKRVDDVIKTTANLELKLVQDSAESRETLTQKQGGRISRHLDIYERKNPKTGIVDEYLLLKKEPDITGECISGARMGYGGKLASAPVVYFNLKPGGDCAGKFGRLTGQNIGKQLAIVLDNAVMSAPVIRDRISDNGVIEGRFNPEEATDLSIVLTTGSLKVPLVKDRVEVVGPSLGLDHIQRGELACLVGGLFVIIFMAMYYKGAGLMADFAVIVNVVFVLAALSTFGATLTLPGLAGIVLTIGMAVDANVLVNERIREELRSGKTPRTSVELGYEKALSAILDSNITTFIAGAVLYFNGTGPIKGFAVTLMFGIISSVFTAIYVTRIMFDYRLEKYPGEALSI